MPKTTNVLEGGKRHPLNMRTTKETRDKLERSARENGRSLAQEVEVRLEQSFYQEALLPSVLVLAYGNTLAGLVMLVGEAMWRAGSGSVAQDAISRGEDANLRDRMRDWANDPAALDQAILAALTALRWARPADATKELPSISAGAQRSAEQLLHDVRHAPSILGSDDRLQHVRRLLGPIAERETPTEKRRGARLQSAGRSKRRTEEQSS